MFLGGGEGCKKRQAWQAHLCCLFSNCATPVICLISLNVTRWRCHLRRTNLTLAKHAFLTQIHKSRYSFVRTGQIHVLWGIFLTFWIDSWYEQNINCNTSIVWDWISVHNLIFLVVWRWAEWRVHSAQPTNRCARLVCKAGWYVLTNSDHTFYKLNCVTALFFAEWWGDMTLTKKSKCAQFTHLLSCAGLFAYGSKMVFERFK